MPFGLVIIRMAEFAVIMRSKLGWRRSFYIQAHAKRLRGLEVDRQLELIGASTGTSFSFTPDATSIRRHAPLRVHRRSPIIARCPASEAGHLA